MYLTLGLLYVSNCNTGFNMVKRTLKIICEKDVLQSEQSVGFLWNFLIWELPSVHRDPIGGKCSVQYQDDIHCITLHTYIHCIMYAGVC